MYIAILPDYYYTEVIFDLSSLLLGHAFASDLKDREYTYIRY